MLNLTSIAFLQLSSLDRDYRRNKRMTPDKFRASTEQVPSKYRASTPHTLEILSFCEIPRKRDEIQEYLALKHREHFRSTVLAPLLKDELLKPLIPDKPKSPLQKYIITERGKQFLKKHSPGTS